VLVQKFMDAGQVRDAAIDHRAAGLDEVDVAVMDLADRIAADATSVTQADVDRLRELGLGDQEIFGVALAASIRCFFSTALDAMGVQPDARFSEMPGDLRDALTVGRPIGPA
jgi:alkylhydroperoxidase family enzyme